MFRVIANVLLLLCFSTESSARNIPCDLDLSVVQVRQDIGENRSYFGTAFIGYFNATKGTILVTNAHICGDVTKPIFVLDHDIAYQAIPLGKSNKTDLCALYVPPGPLSGMQALSLANKDVEPWDQVVSYGYPKKQARVSRGRPTERKIRSTDRAYYSIAPGPTTSMEVVGSTMLIDFGASGSPVVNKRCEVVGVIHAMQGGTKKAYYVPLGDLREFLEVVLNVK